MMTNYMDPNSIHVSSDFDAFLAIARHLFAQREKCFSAYSDCAYRGSDDVNHNDDENDEMYDNIIVEPNGKSCAVGILIKDSQYDVELEEQAVVFEVVQQAVKNSHPDWVWSDRTLAMLSICQSIHDVGNVSFWPVYFCELIPYFGSYGSEDFAFGFDGDIHDIHELAANTLGIKYTPMQYYYNVDDLPGSIFDQYLDKFERVVAELERS